jgi:hypothetical protein
MTQLPEELSQIAFGIAPCRERRYGQIAHVDDGGAASRGQPPSTIRLMFCPVVVALLPGGIHWPR